MSGLRHTISVGDKEGTVTLDTNAGYSGVGNHDVCGGCVDWRHVSALWSVLRCRKCGMRVWFPAAINRETLDKDLFYTMLIEYFKRR